MVSVGAKKRAVSATVVHLISVQCQQMVQSAFVSAFTGASVAPNQRNRSSFCAHHVAQSCKRKMARASRLHMSGIQHGAARSERAKAHRVVGIVAKSADSTKKATTDVDAGSGKGLFGMKANAYWDSMGVLPLFFVGFGITALVIKMVKVKGGQLRSGSSGLNKVTVPKTVITSEEEEAELHVFKCGGCGYEMYPARGREFKFFPDSFKCPLCGTPKSEFWDLNDPDDPRNQEPDEEDENDVIGEDGSGDGPTAISPDDSPEGGEETEKVTDRADADTSTSA